MCLKFVVALALVAVASARYLGGADTYFVDVGREYIKVVSPQGDQLKFIVDNYYGYSAPQTIQIYFYGQGVAPKTVQYLDQDTNGGYDSDILYQIFNKYEGQIDEIQYEKLLTIISSLVKDGQINPVILYALKALFGQYEALNYLDTYQGSYGQTPYNKMAQLYGRGYGYGSYRPSYEKEGSYGVGSYYPGKYEGYGQGVYGSQYGQGFLGKYYGKYGYQYGSEYPQQYGPFSSEYYSSGSFYPKQYGSYGPYASKSYSSYGSSLYPSYYPGSSSYGSYSKGYGDYNPSYSSSYRSQWPVYDF